MILLIILFTLSYQKCDSNYAYPSVRNPEIVIYVDYFNSNEKADTIQYEFMTTLADYSAIELYGYIDSLKIEARTYIFPSDTLFNRWELVDEFYEVDSVYRSGLALNYGKWTEIRLINLSKYWYTRWRNRDLWEREFTFRFLIKFK